ncbi:MAG: hypothetical protein WC091_15105 [Sulfuricellaceae bacterium]
MANKILLAFVIVAIYGCDNTNRAISTSTVPVIPTDIVTVDRAIQLKAGENKSLDIAPGRYKLDLISIDGNANVGFEWVGAACPDGDKRTHYTSICDMPTNGQLIIKNPAPEIWDKLGLKPAINVSVKLTRLAK